MNQNIWSASITDWLSVIIYFFTLSAAFVAAFIANKALKENKSIALDTKRMADDNANLVRQQTQPFIDIKLEVMPQSINWIRLRISNIGLSSAFNISFNFRVLDKNNQLVIEKIIEEFSKIGFVTKGLSYLSKGDARYTAFINLYESYEKRGLTSEDFFKASFVVGIEFSDLVGRKYKNEFHLNMNELEGHYQIGESDQKKIVNQLEEINKNIKSFKNEHENFKKEYEKSHRDWTEEELRMKVRGIDLKRARYEYLNIEYPESTIKRKRKDSIHELRKRNR